MENAAAMEPNQEGTPPPTPAVNHSLAEPPPPPPPPPQQRDNIYTFKKMRKAKKEKYIHSNHQIMGHPQQKSVIHTKGSSIRKLNPYRKWKDHPKMSATFSSSSPENRALRSSKESGSLISGGYQRKLTKLDRCRRRGQQSVVVKCGSQQDCTRQSFPARGSTKLAKLREGYRHHQHQHQQRQPCEFQDGPSLAVVPAIGRREMAVRETRARRVPPGVRLAHNSDSIINEPIIAQEPENLERVEEWTTNNACNRHIGVGANNNPLIVISPAVISDGFQENSQRFTDWQAVPDIENHSHDFVEDSIVQDAASSRASNNNLQQHFDESNLAVATLVQEPSCFLLVGNPDTLPRATQFNQDDFRQQKMAQRRKLLFRFLCVGSFLLTGTALLAVLVRAADDKEPSTITLSVPPTNRENTSATDSPSLAPTSRDQQILDLLPEYSYKSITEDSQSPQSLAYQWLVNDSSFETYSNSRTLQRFALATIYFSLHGDEWANNTDWLSSEVHECQWFYRDFVIETGMVGPYISSATNETWPCYHEDEYRYLWLDANQLHGTVPPEIALMTSLTSIKLSANSITGSIPTTIGLLTNLVSFEVVANELSSSIPTEIGHLSNLIFLNLANNQLTSTVPRMLGFLSNLNFLQLSSNLLTGSLFSELHHLTNLHSISLNDNLLSGFLPATIGFMTALNQLFDVEINSLSGSLPSEVGLLSNLTAILLGQNSLSGQLPSELAVLPALKLLDASSNSFSGSLFSEIGLLSNMTHLFLPENKITCGIPSSIGGMSALHTIDLSENRLTGFLPTTLGDLSKLVLFSFMSNNITGTIPSEIGNLKSLQLLALLDNELTSTIPSELFRLSFLQSLYLFKNHLTGSISSLIGKLPFSMDTISFGLNNLRGSIPTQFANLLFLKVADLRNNSLTGTVPSDLGRLRRLETLWLVGNQLSSSIPNEVGSLAAVGALTQFGVAGNSALTGTLPSELCGIEKLSVSCTDLLCGCHCSCYKMVNSTNSKIVVGGSGSWVSLSTGSFGLDAGKKV